MSTLAPLRPRFHYPASDGEPMADNTLQFEWIVTIQGNLDAMYREVPDIFVAGDHLIYPIENNADIRFAPDIYVAYGRPKGHRGSYAVSDEDGIFPQVIFEVWSPNNRQQKMEEKREFYEKYGAEEYYIVYPEFPAHIDGWLRQNEKFVRIPEMNGFVSPRMKIKFELKRGKIAIYKPDGERFLSFVEVRTLADEERARAIVEQERAEQERARAAAEQERAEQERARAAAEQERAEQERARAAAEQQRAETAELRAAKLAAKLRELGIDPDGS